MPLVCSALGSRKFAKAAAAHLASRSGPAAGANVVFDFLFNEPRDPAASVARDQLADQDRPKEQYAQPAADHRFPSAVDFRDSLALVSCVKSKLPAAAPARQLYTSPLFVGVRDYVEAHQCPWYILSALHGLVHPDQVVAPYERTLKGMDAADRRAWAAGVLDQLLPIAQGYRRVIFFAGASYREFLVEPLRKAGHEVSIPLRRLRQGEQLAWLSQRR